MIVVEKLLLEGGPFQWVFASALTRVDIDLVVSDGPDSLSFPDPGADLVFTLHGSGLSVGPGGPFNGTANRVVITSLGDPGGSVDITLPTATPVDTLVDTARAVPPGRPGDLKDFNRVLMPDDSPFPDLFFTGGDGPNVALGFDGNDVFDLGGGNDTVYITPGNDQIDGGPGKDTVSGEFFDGPVDINLRSGTLTADAINAALKNIEGAYGSGYDDTITGNKKSNQLFGDDGDDTLKGGSGRDRIEGVNGADLIDGGTGNDALSGGSGRDKITGGAGEDSIDGGGGNDKLSGGRGADTATGGSGKDKINGGAGDDILEGGRGNDRLEGGEGNDTLFGGPGRDTLIFRAVTKGRTEGDDTVIGFEAGKDTIAIVGGAPGDLSVTTSGGDTIIDYGNGTIIIEDQTLTQDQITFEYGL